MNTIFKATLLAGLILSSTAAYAIPSDRACMSVGKMAAYATDERDSGTLEDEVISTYTSSMRIPSAKRIVTSMITYVYTNSHNKQSNRELSYLKCLAGDFD